MVKAGVIGHKGMCGKELLTLLTEHPTLFSRNDSLDFSDLDVLFLAVSSKETKKIVQHTQKSSLKIIDLSSAYRMNKDIPLILPTVNSHLINNSLTHVSLPNCIVSILLTALTPLHKISPIKKILLSTYQAASGAGKAGLQALESDHQIAPFPHPLRDNLFLHESVRNEHGLCGEEVKIADEIRKILEDPSICISSRCVRVPVKRAHSIHAVVSFEQNIHNIEKILENEKDICLHPSPTPLLAEHKKEVFVGPVRKSPWGKSTYDFWIVGDQLLRGAALNAFEAFEGIKKARSKERAFNKY